MSTSTGKMIREVTQFLQRYDIMVIASHPSRRHRWLEVTDGAKTAMVLISASPSDRRTYHNIVKTARQALREAP